MMLSQMLRFGFVGGLATVLHIIVGLGCIRLGHPALLANVFAFLTAFAVSFAGHLVYSFADQKPSPRRAFWKFALVAIIGFLCNEAILAALLSGALLSPQFGLAVSTACAACLTFGLSRCWAFQGVAQACTGSR